MTLSVARVPAPQLSPLRYVSPRGTQDLEPRLSEGQSRTSWLVSAFLQHSLGQAQTGRHKKTAIKAIGDHSTQVDVLRASERGEIKTGWSCRHFEGRCSCAQYCHTVSRVFFVTRDICAVLGTLTGRNSLVFMVLSSCPDYLVIIYLPKKTKKLTQATRSARTMRRPGQGAADAPELRARASIPRTYFPPISYGGPFRTEGVQ